MPVSDTAILDTVLNQLKSKGPQNLAQLQAALPELGSDPNGPDMLRLLLRLDRRLCLRSDGRWALAAGPQTLEQRVITSTQTYLNQIPGGGAPLSSLVAHITEETGYAASVVRPIILRSFENNGRVVRNRRKEAQ